MQKDTRRITVSRDHLRSASDELSIAVGNPERSMAEAAARRALDHLNLVTRRLTEERAIAGKMEHGPAIDEAFRCSELAWHAVSESLNHWEHRERLPEARQHVTNALHSLDEACELAPEDKVHA